MILHYVYILDYEGVFINIGFNLGGAYRFKYDINSKHLEVTENPFYTKDFFNLLDSTENGNAAIGNVSGIIGGNGSGKSSFLAFMKTNFVRGMSGMVYPVIVALTTDDGELKLYHDRGIPIENNSGDFLGFEIIETSSNATKHVIPGAGVINISNRSEIDELVETDFVFLSNVFDNVVQYEFQGLHNLSTDFLLKNDLKAKAELINTWGINLMAANSEIDFHKFQDLHRQLEFINANKMRENVPFDLPNKVIVSIGKDLLFSKDSEIGLQAESMLNAYEYQDFIRRFKSYAQLQLDKNDFKSRGVIYITANALLNYFYEIAIFTRYYRISGLDDFKIESFQNYQQAFDNLIQFLVTDLENFKRVSDKDRFAYEPYGKDLDQLKGLKELLDFLLLNLSKQNVGERGNNFLIEGSVKYIDEFFSIYRRTYRYDSYLNFTWYDLSSGQKAFLNIYARLYSLSDQIISQRGANLILKKNIIVLVDEGEAFLHPNWQKSFLTNLLEFLQSNFRSVNFTRSIQCILTSNSPFLASDLPSSNVCFLKKDKQGVTKIHDSLEDRKQTFAANIHSLLTDAFFMEQGTIGEFAKRKINKVIELLQKKQSTIESNRELIENTINMIGEPVIKSKLTQMLAERISVDYINLGNRIRSLEEDVKELKKKQ
ncbi:MAG TPA: AAA family ATPase [Cyclobacteriaceae bacterium]|jgi:hypothetical protein|nr:AAA family ATPase [Cyclobacteriaceae bacterium]